MSKKIMLLVSVLLIASFALASCATPTPETIIQTVEVEVEKEVIQTVEVEKEVVQTVEVMVEPEEKTVVEFWTTDNEPDRVEVYEKLADDYMVMHPEIDLRIVVIDEASISQRIATARAANRLPDIVRMGIERVVALSADELLDEAAAEEVITSIGEDDFRANPLWMVTNPATGNYAAIPYDGWIQAIWYRTDIFDELGLDAPTSWETIDAACDALPGTGNLLYALGLGTDPSQNYPHQVFEQVAMSNNAWPLDSEGNVTMNTPR